MLLASRGHKQRPLIIKSSSNVAHSSNYNPNHMRNLTALPKSSEHTKSKACSSPPPSTSQTSDTQQVHVRNEHAYIPNKKQNIKV